MKLFDESGRLQGCGSCGGVQAVKGDPGGELRIEPAAPRAVQPASFKLFLPSGCLSDQGLAALVREELDEEQRMEVSEHLDFCDSCVERYAALLSGEELLTPPAPVAPAVMEELRPRTRMLFFGRLMRVSIAAAMALVIWNGLLLGNGGLFKFSTDWVNSRPQREQSVSQTVGGWGSGLNDLMNGLNSWMNSGVQGEQSPRRNSSPEK